MCDLCSKVLIHFVPQSPSLWYGDNSNSTNQQRIKIIDHLFKIQFSNYMWHKSLTVSPNTGQGLNKWFLGFPGGSVVKNPPANAGATGDKGMIPWSGRSPGAGNGNPLQYSCLDNSTDRWTRWATRRNRGVMKSWTWLSTHTCRQIASIFCWSLHLSGSLRFLYDPVLYPSVTMKRVLFIQQMWEYIMFNKNTIPDLRKCIGFMGWQTRSDNSVCKFSFLHLPKKELTYIYFSSFSPLKG